MIGAAPHPATRSARVACPEPLAGEDRQRDWFLRGSVWSDALWILAPTRVLDEEHPVRIRWDFTLSEGQRFTDPHWTALLQSAKQHLALIRAHSLSFGLAQNATTVEVHFYHLRSLVRWMDRAGLRHFSELDAEAVLQFTRAMQGRAGRTTPALTAATLATYLHLLLYLYRHRHSLDDALQVDPCPGQSAFAVAGARRSEHRHLPYTPDVVALPLIQGAIEFLSTSAIDLLRAREIYTQAIAGARHRGLGTSGCNAIGARAVQPFTIGTPRGPCRIDSLSVLAELIDMLYAACFVVIAYLMGPRMSEILHLQAGCVQPLSAAESADAPTGLAVIIGAIFKHESGFHGRPHQWVAPPPVVHAISVLEALSAPHRQRSARRELCLRPHHRALNAQWQADCRFPLWIPHPTWINILLRRFGVWLELPDHDGAPWHLTSHQGRKTFARFVALRDRTSLFALAQHLGHRDRAITDQGYAGTDYQLNREIDAQVLEQSLSAWEHMLSAPQLGGRAGREIVAQRPRFRGAHLKEDLQSYARMLLESGLLLGVCDYGYCVYRQEYSACLGNAAGPNPVRREPSTCARCKNFVVSTEHRAYWLDQVRRHEALLNEPALPTQTLKIARARLEEARALLRSIDSTAQHKKQDPRHDRKTSP